MKKVISLVLLVATINLYNPVLAKTIEVNSGTRIPITVKNEFTSKNVLAGQKIEAIIEDDINIKNIVVFRRGDPAIINVSDVKKAKCLGIPGEIYIVNGEVVDANGNKHLIEYNQKITGEEKTYPKVCLGCGMFIILAPLVLVGFVKGGQAKINPNKPLDTSLRSDFQFDCDKL